MQSADDDSFRRKNKRDEFRFNSIASCLSEVTKSAVNSSEYWLLLHGFKNNKDENIALVLLTNKTQKSLSYLWIFVLVFCLLPVIFEYLFHLLNKSP